MDEDGAPDDLLSQLVAAPTAPRKVTGDQALRVMQMARQTGVVPAVDYANLVSSSPRGPGGVLGYMAAAGYGVQNMPSYLPSAGGVAPTQVGSGQMDDDQEETTGGLATGLAASAGAQQPAPAAQSTMSLADLIAQRQSLGAQQQAAIQSVYDTTAAQLQQQRQRAQGGLSASDLFKLAGAFATPTRNSSFMGALANVNPVLADITQAREAVVQNYPTQQAALRQKYLLDTLAAQAGTLKDVTSPVEKYAQLNKGPQAKALQPGMTFATPGQPTPTINTYSHKPSKTALVQHTDGNWYGYVNGKQGVYERRGGPTGQLEWFDVGSGS